MEQRRLPPLRLIVATILLGVLATAEFWTDFADKHWLLPATAGAVAVIQGALAYSWVSFRMQREDFLLDELCKDTRAHFHEFDPSLRIAVTVVRWTVRRARPRRVLRPVKGVGFLQTCPDRRVVLCIGEGVAGTAVEKRQPASGDRDSDTICLRDGNVLRPVDRGMNDQQRNSVTHLQFIYSWPIHKLRAVGRAADDVGKVVGTVTVDSGLKKSDWENGNKLSELEIHLAVLSKRLAHIMQ